METNVNLTALGAGKDVDFENLYPAIVSCFVVIIIGYISGRANLITQTESKGMNTFMGYFALPSLIFINMVEMDLSSVNWLFLLAILIAKTFIFIVVLVIHLLVIKPRNKASAGLLAIFATQSNDFAIGFPIVSALYKTTHPDYPSYMYLVAPINLAILNPIAFILMEVQREQETVDTRRQKGCAFVVKVAKNIVANPVIFMTVLGLICNFIFKHNLPIYLKSVLEILGSAFSACALFTLGMRMVGKINQLKGIRLVIPGLLIIGKLLALPVLIRELVNFLHVGKDANDTLDWSTFGFLYGTIPSAPIVFVFAVQYGVEIDLIAACMVGCTFVSAPWMFVSAKMITLTQTNPSQYLDQLNSFIFDVSIVSLIASFWVLTVFAVTKKINKIPHKFTACLVVSQIFSCTGAIMGKVIDHKLNVPSYVQFLFFTTGVYSGRMWTGIIAITLLFMECRSLCFIVFKLQPFFMLFGWGIPILLSTLLLVFDKNKVLPDHRNPNFVYGVFQAIVAVSLLVLCFIVTAGCLILHEMYRKRHQNYWNLTNGVSNDAVENDDMENESEPSTSTCINEANKPSECDIGNCCSLNKCSAALPTINESAENSPNPNVVDIEDLFGESTRSVEDNGAPGNNELCPSGLACKTGANDYCQGIIQQYQETVDDDLELIEEERSTHDPQILRHAVLLILLMCSMFVGLAVSIWTLIMEQMSGIYIELAFLDVSLNFGQSIIVFAVFGTDTRDILLPLMKRWRKMWFRTNKLILPMESELSPETKLICEQFRKHHLAKCREDIAANKRWGLKLYEQVFSGRKFVDWIIDVGLARDRIEAINYARHLIEGRVLHHIKEVYHFYDKNLLYSFD